MQVPVDADACPAAVKDMSFRAARRARPREGKVFAARLDRFLARRGTPGGGTA
ncbi:hypothetical protein [Burkholderia ubonensis]|uniref:hypothetical protein n=1 Tax=Burkholderia ubonensis TaxID=101571 RepID=UPI0018DF37C8|nr:hypothetical protein [Burkholderia ubonensis]